MSANINVVVITGNLARDAELRRTQTGAAVMNFSVAVNDRRKNHQTGEWEDVPSYVDCVMFGNRAESLANYMLKGTKVGVDGKLNYSSWERDGQKRSKLEVFVDEIELLSPKQQGQQSYGGQPPYEDDYGW